jgi:hypothetical protein
MENTKDNKIKTIQNITGQIRVSKKNDDPGDMTNIH